MKVFMLLALISIVASQALLGGKQPMSLDDEKLIELVQFSLSELNESRGVSKEPKLESKGIKILRAESQVVAGAKYFIEFETKNSDGDKYTCKVIIWSKPWEDFTQLLDSDCTISS